jgi:hypothetical protein
LISGTTLNSPYIKSSVFSELINGNVFAGITIFIDVPYLLMLSILSASAIFAGFTGGTFAAYNPNGTSKTIFKPDEGQSYWDGQSGEEPWFGGE